ncbi:MAG: sigma-54-dependent transcriptional regulator [bacterium]
MSFRILIVDDDRLISKSICRTLESEGFLCSCVYSGEDALRRFKEEPFDLVLLDLSLPGMDGFQTMEHIRREHPDIQISILTASQDIHDAIRAIRQGADDYLIKSADVEELKVAVKKALRTYNLATENVLLKKQLQRRFEDERLTVFESRAMKHVYHMIRRVSRLENTTVLIVGESGTGKELVARTIHRLSPRAEKPFVDISCSALPTALLESELFGFEKGAFTDAKTQKRGLLELTDCGTLFLDEIATLDLSIQAKLLRFLEQRTFRRIGGTVDLKVDLRVIAATNRDLRKMIASLSFREDLFYRLNVFPITLPPLRERREDILPLAGQFIERFNHEFTKHITGLRQDSRVLLEQYNYPGNVRELKNIIERAMIMEEQDCITPSSLHFPRGNSYFAEPITPRGAQASEESGSERVFPTLSEVEERHIREALSRAGGNKNMAAKLLGIGRSTLFRKLALLDKH